LQKRRQQPGCPARRALAAPPSRSVAQRGSCTGRASDHLELGIPRTRITRTCARRPEHRHRIGRTGERPVMELSSLRRFAGAGVKRRARQPRCRAVLRAVSAQRGGAHEHRKAAGCRRARQAAGENRVVAVVVEKRRRGLPCAGGSGYSATRLARPSGLVRARKLVAHLART